MSTRIADRVAWSEGVLLVPQHFQQLDRYHESLLSYRLDALTPGNWGVLHLEWDLRSLQQGVASLLSFQGILPDGTPLALGEQSGGRLPKGRPIQAQFPASQKSLRVYLAVPTERAHVNNYAPEGDALRYSLITRKVHDVTRDDRSADIGVAQPNLSLLFGSESQSGFTTLPIAEFVRNERGELAVSDSYIPPCLRMGSSPVFAERQTRLVRTMVGRLKSLSQARRLTGEGRVEFTAADVTRFLQINALNSMLPAMNHLARASDVSPHTAFLLLSQLVGQLATFSPEVDMTVPIDFEFAEPSNTFHTLFNLCAQLLAGADTERFLSCLLQPHGQNRRYADLRDVRLERCVSFLLAVESKLPRPQVVEEIVRRAKVASHGDMDFVLNKNVGGINVTESLRPPTELPVNPGLVYFELPNPETDVYWKHVQQDRNLVVWLPPLLEQAQTQVKLIGVFGSR